VYGGAGSIVNCASKLTGFAAADPALADLDTTEKIYASIAGSPEQLKHLNFWLCIMMGSWGCFEVTWGLGLLSSLFMPFERRYIQHFLASFNNFLFVIHFAKLGWGVPIGTVAYEEVGFGADSNPGAGPAQAQTISEGILCAIHLSIGTSAFLAAKASGDTAFGAPAPATQVVEVKAKEEEDQEP
jgi:hypothetical protein